MAKQNLKCNFLKMCSRCLIKISRQKYKACPSNLSFRNKMLSNFFHSDYYYYYTVVELLLSSMLGNIFDISSKFPEFNIISKF